MMSNYVWIALLLLALMGSAVLGIYILSLKRRVEYLHNLLSSLMTNGNLIFESMTFVATAYGLSVDELMKIIENYQNATGERK